VTDVPYATLFICVSVVSTSLAIMTALQPRAIEHLAVLAHFPYLGKITVLVSMRSQLVDCCSVWLYLDAADV
jgi:hypothetical protein